MIRLFLILFLFFNFLPVKAFENLKINFGNYSLNKYEITIKEFKKYAKKNNIITEAEKTGGGYEWGAGWEKREGWNYKTPYGKVPKSDLEPAVHISRFEAENYCKSINGRLPSFEEWSKAAYTQQFNSNEFLYHAGTAKINDKIFSIGGRVLNFVNISDNFSEARDNLIKKINSLNWSGGFFRKDIGHKVIEK